jgi:lipopolysaccharide/colanic/teichoic acid biosynthesis glycosyltransferase
MSRLIDIVLALILLLMTLPVWVLILILILIFSPGSPFFIHERVGKHGKLFGLVKFRTMSSRKSEGPDITVAGDRRVTGIGRFLRALKLDELPQLLNILVGQMTFVGPRPESPYYVKEYTSAQKCILDYKPGLVDPATLKYRNEERLLAGFEDSEQAYLQKILPDKLEISLKYQKKRNLFSDLGIILKTFAAIFRRR